MARRKAFFFRAAGPHRALLLHRQTIYHEKQTIYHKPQTKNHQPPKTVMIAPPCQIIGQTNGVLEGMEEEFKPENSWETTMTFNPDSEVGKYKRLKTWTRKVIPKKIL